MQRGGLIVRIVNDEERFQSKHMQYYTAEPFRKKMWQLIVFSIVKGQ